MQQVILKIFITILRAVSPEISTGLRLLLSDLRRKAAATENPFDDMLVMLLFAMLDMDYNEVDEI